MKRLTSTTCLNIVTTTVLDAAGRAVSTIRTGSDASQITLRQSTFDLAGRLLGETNALDAQAIRRKSLSEMDLKALDDGCAYRLPRK